MYSNTVKKYATFIEAVSLLNIKQQYDGHLKIFFLVFSLMAMSE